MTLSGMVIGTVLAARGLAGFDAGTASALVEINTAQAAAARQREIGPETRRMAASLQAGLMVLG